MQKVIAINLNGNAYQLEDSGYAALGAYLDRAGQALAGNPDRAEILADLEQAIADKCQTFLHAHKSVVSGAEVNRIIAEMGPVDVVDGGESKGGPNGEPGAEPGDDRHEGAGPNAASRRLYQIPEGAVLAGVCNGLAAYVGIDVTIVRVAFVLLALFTNGWGIVAYIALALLMPSANTPEERAAASGAPFNARAVVDRARRHARRQQRDWKRHLRYRHRAWPHASRVRMAPFGHVAPVVPALILPLFGMIHLALFLLFAAVVIAAVNTGAIFGWPLPAGLPTWAAVLILFGAYHIVASPLEIARRVQYPSSSGVAVWHGVLWLGCLAFVAWLGFQHVPEIREFVQRMPVVFREFLDAIGAGA